MALSRGYVTMYVVLVGVASVIEKPVGRGFGAFQLNALIRAGGLAAAAATLVLAHGFVLPAVPYILAGLSIGLLTAKEPRLPMTTRTLGGFGVGVMIGTASVFYFLGLRALPVSVAAASSNAYVVVTVALSAIFLHQPLSRTRGGAMALTLLGVTLLAVSPG